MWGAPAFVYLAAIAVLPLCHSDGYAAPFGCTSNVAMTDDTYRDKILTLHNDERRKVAQGGAQDQAGSWLPQAQNMYKLKYDCSLEDMAFSFVVNCNATAPQSTTNAILYNNKAQQADAEQLKVDVESYIALLAGVQNWPKQNLYETAVAKYADIIRADATAVGCAQALCPLQANGPTASTACVYNKPPLTAGDPIYKSGQECKAASDCTTYTPSTCDNGLCLKEDETTTTSMETTTTMATAGNMCPMNADMNDRIRNAAIQMHNYRRRLLAQGSVRKNNGNLLPSASNMIKLKYNCSLESEAKTSADRCVNSETTGVQENVFVYTRTTRVNATQEMAWAQTQSLGCGVGRCGTTYSVVCRYYPPGNVVNSVVYAKGAPCGNCPNGSNCDASLCAFP